jgi:hypothetical protein
MQIGFKDIASLVYELLVILGWTVALGIVALSIYMALWGEAKL